MKRAPYTDCRIYIDGVPELKVGDYLRTPGGSAYLVTEMRQNARRPHRRHLRCLRWPVAEVPDDATIFEFHWYKRASKRTRRLA
jgi:hypothetical protein